MHRVLQVLPTLKKSTGIAQYVMNYRRVIDPAHIAFDYLVHQVDIDSFASEAELYGGSVIDFPWMEFKTLPRLRNELEDFYRENASKYDVVHCHMPNAAFLHLSFAKKYGIKLRIIHSHTAQSSPYLLRRVRNAALEPIGLAMANRRIACSERAGKALFHNKDFNVVPNAIDLTRFRQEPLLRHKTRCELGVLDDTCVIGYVSRLVKGKGLESLIRYFSDFHSLVSDSVLIIIGDGPEGESIKQLAAELGISSAVILLGYKENTEDYYNAMDAFVFPSESEGLGLVAIEAQACGVPCVLSHGIPKDADISGTSLFMNRRSTSKEWALAIKRQIDRNPSISRSELLSSRFNIETSAEILETVYLGRGYI